MSRRSSRGARPHGQRPHRRDVVRSSEAARPTNGRVDPAQPSPAQPSPAQPSPAQSSPAQAAVAADQPGGVTVVGHVESEVPGASPSPEGGLEVAPPTGQADIRPPTEHLEIPPLAASPDAAETGSQSVAPATTQPAAPVAGGGCTAAQLRRFIKSRAYVPMHELRRRFEINGTEDDVTRVSTAAGHVFVGLPPREGQLLGELLRGGDIGYELSLDPVSPIVIGVYPMRPISRS